MRLQQFQIDAFSGRAFCGNPAAVVPLTHWVPEACMQAIAAENQLSETAFVVPEPGEGSYALRWFTPTEEVRLCGHATLASGHALLMRDGGDKVMFRTRRAGLLAVTRGAAGYELALPLIPTEPDAWAQAVDLLRAKPQDVWLSPDRYGIYLFENEEQVRALDPDLRGLAALGNDQFICTAPGLETDVVSRVFVPGGGVDEDSFTGSAHAALTYFWTERLGRDSFTAFQASQRGGHAVCRRDGDRAILSGSCITVVEGSFVLP